MSRSMPAGTIILGVGQMKHEKWLSCLMGAALAFAGSVAGVGCVMTGFGIRQTVSFPGVMLMLACWSVAAAALLTVTHGGKWLAALSVVLVAVLLYQKDIFLQMESLVNKLSFV